MENQKNQLVDSIKGANNVLITVSTNPTVDQLAAAIGLTLALNKLKKHATTVFSGEVPSTIEFLSPDDTIETNTDSLRDFIISLDKAKADKIRYKVEDTMVKIFITPYKSSITEQDLVFSQGDFNVDVVVALGVQTRDDLDQAITTHGRILHDATVTTINIADSSEMGSINWHDQTASSLCEMVVEILTNIKDDVLDEQMATALLTGIVAETDRFSNERTTSVTMSASATLMAAGANQQLVATKLDVLTDGIKENLNSDSDIAEDETPEVSIDEDGALRIHHDNDKAAKSAEPEPAAPADPGPKLPEPQDIADSGASSQPPNPAPEETQEPTPAPVQVNPEPVDATPAESRLRVGRRRAFDNATPEPAEPAADQSAGQEPPKESTSRMISGPPSTGGSLNATTDGKTGDEPVLAPPSRSTMATPSRAGGQSLPPAAPQAVAPQQATQPPSTPPVQTTAQPTSEPHVDRTTIKEIEAAVGSHHRSEPARVMEGKTLQAIEDAVGGTTPPRPQPSVPASSDAPSTPDEEAIRARIDEALKNSPSANAPAMEPIAALGAGGRLEISHDNTDTSNNRPQAPSSEETPKAIQIDNDGTVRYPENLVPETKELPKDQTASSSKDPSAPPPVPPPMTMPSPSNTP